MILLLENWNTSNKLWVISFKNEASILSHRISLLEIIYANEKGFPKNSNNVLFGAYILGAAATHQMDEPIVSQKLMELANDIDSEAAKGHYEYFLSIRNK